MTLKTEQEKSNYKEAGHRLVPALELRSMRDCASFGKHLDYGY